MMAGPVASRGPYVEATYAGSGSTDELRLLRTKQQPVKTAAVQTESFGRGRHGPRVSLNQLRDRALA